jgi:protein-S-isoprenylcysteine O-methyltransferase Ste14
VTIWHFVIVGPWIVFIVYWIYGAMKTRRTESKEPGSSRLMFLVWEIAGYALLFSDTVRIGFLGERIVHRTWTMAATGVALVWIGIGLAIWARRHLGEYWSARITIKEDHKLIRSGPYARLRHPIYSGLDLAVIGSALAIDEWGCLLGVVLIIGGYWIKARREEAMLSAQFGDAFREHCRHTGFLLPKLG